MHKDLGKYRIVREIWIDGIYFRVQKFHDPITLFFPGWCNPTPYLTVFKTEKEAKAWVNAARNGVDVVWSE